MQRRRLAWVLGTVTAMVSGGAVLSVPACSTVPDQNYGDPTGLRSANLPGEAGAVVTGVCEGGLGLPADAAVPEGGCRVSFERDLYPRFLLDGGWRCAAPACHGGGQPPVLDGGSPEALLATLRGYSLQGTPYLAPSTDGGDPKRSALYCNLLRTCGSPMPPSVPAKPQELCILETWLRCGAPSN